MSDDPSDGWGPSRSPTAWGGPESDAGARRRDLRLIASTFVALTLAVIATTALTGDGDGTRPFAAFKSAGEDDRPEPVPARPSDEVAPPADGEVTESHAIIRGGKIYLEGAVPDQASADAIVALATEVLGAGNVVDNYTIDPRASDPNLGNVRVEDHVLFEFNSATIAPSFEPVLLQAVTLMTIRPEVTMTVVGHADSLGGEDYNLSLSQRRAEAVVAFMAERGVDPARLTAVGMGEAEPVAPNETDEGRQLNRRIQVYLQNLLAPYE